MNYQCPLCFTPLNFMHNSYRCAENHQFDCAKEGYVNLLPVQHKRSKDPGDNAEMMQARRQFLDAGHYHPMREKVAEKIIQFIPSSNTSLLDIGCGEGYYTDYFSRELAKHFEKYTVLGLDVSKVAVRYAAKRYKSVRFCVGTSHRLPFSNNSLGGVVRIYAPCKAQELSRVLVSKGMLITVTPAAEHLQELKALIYDEVKLHPTKDEDLPNFSLIDSCQLNYKMALTGQEAYELLMMTPFAWRASEQVKENLQQAEVKEYTADFLIRVYQSDAE
ncbi:23S rRNA (guanine(745)-N(1))-methyltransferase [Providencia hangzhouensis]|uniref:23S rRNA (Guanine(745)-N(1))-methyltransferase n=1 Tax=Providencia rettgeri TaxID=587 RepID=A0AAE2ZFP9_PRORE|nr:MULTISPECIES: 23S rRNA (guanine(745)-N(1))-methyltransferase [Providencia]MRF65875.1 23S rRNA (guanine(745)-N(1))-methyltransferase [Escherichia coli]EHZ6871859.1 23S rRNA (guanine(745)-N(1))-methyltransferase [Providencia rettgeri]EHZ6874461.1 23S rRNA (guanine(745)-N(1))-methyltransferase [Providencia rettgeri]MBG5892878.1 23S rRNA (guanine(745)-N(1))-methyltransferase [Providencia rettgeri]MBI6187852.1 23S rRNA (guanine(745)-N(1))-methyltransferase [Providencia rettgeri]